MKLKAIIVAAGLSSRLRPLTNDTPKCMLPVNGDESLIDRSIRLLISKGVTDFIIVTGYKENKLKDHLSKFSGVKINFVYNHDYENTNNMISLHLGLMDAIKFYEDVIYLHSDIAYDERILDELLRSRESDPKSILMMTDFQKELTNESMKIQYHKNKWNSSDRILSSKDLEVTNRTGEWIGMTIIPEDAKYEFISKVNDQLISHNLVEDEKVRLAFLQRYDTFAFSHLNYPFKLVSTKGHKWTEMDDMIDYENAKSLLSDEEFI